MKRAAAAMLLVLAATPVAARESLGVFERWGAFRDGSPPRCHAVAEPSVVRTKGTHRPFASVALWPGQSRGAQVHIRLRRALPQGGKVVLGIGQQRLDLLTRGANAWGRDARQDAAIIAAMRGAERMSVTARTPTGGYFVENYLLAGAATAIDAARIGCARR